MPMIFLIKFLLNKIYMQKVCVSVELNDLLIILNWSKFKVYLKWKWSKVSHKISIKKI